ncbi:prolyl 4-hydroxylase subunit alpha [Ktedonosporobacter rubrisoli]|uniref:Prolyl 4-hydroxylase subunit alpha n=1 Tax=Ktedonosporobacter rubrisoli TaxID=2509675 RepID=A0A4P6JI31_KTERU|nr:2OG-Fe(II) oxygenase [Ktedonosporobacter rubrisoli]QBD74530.1 prolyl 4-hydroxylase subunit alpha [Ktedonosporobacter rubrisoli]
MNLTTDIRQRIANYDWDAIGHTMDEQGYGLLSSALTAQECDELIALYADNSKFRTRIDMQRHRFGLGEYKYLAYPLPLIVQELREALYPHLAEIANHWAELLGENTRYPDTLADFLQYCHEHGQTRPTPLILQYQEGGYNSLHQDLYGEVAFPFQVVFLLSQRNEQYTGGESLLIEQRPRAQSIGRVITLERGSAMIFPTHHRPVAGTRGWYRANVRHGVSPVTGGMRYGMGIIFHDAK